MPIYEFYSPDSHRIYAFLARSSELSGRIPRCPDGDKLRMQRVPSRFAFIGRAREQSAADDDLDDPRFEKAMAEIEREFAGMDDENPDPRQLGRMMRRMADLTGEKVPAEMEEMIGRLEAGEDPEKLEEEFADVFDDEGGAESEGTDSEGGPPGPGGRLRSLLARRPPRRDPKLYEMQEYL